MSKCRRIIATAFLVTILGGATAAPAQAQWGLVLDWINKLSGPGFVRIGAHYGFEPGLAGTETRVRVTGMGGWKVSAEEGSDAEDRGMQMYTLQATLETPLVGGSRRSAQLLGVLGVAGHVFSGDDFDSFANFSFPAQVVLRIPVGGRAAVRLGTGFNVFWFPDDAFDPLVVDVATEGFDGAWGATAGFEIGS